MDERGIIKYFEEFQPPEGIRAELLRGEIVMTPSPDLTHNGNVTEVVDQIPRKRWRRLQTVCVDMLGEASVPVPDLVVLERGTGPNHGTLMPSEAVTMLVEVVSRTSVDRDYGVKRSIYAAAEVPGYLIIDPIMAQCVLYAEPRGEGGDADYRMRRITKFGDLTPLEPLRIELDTTEFGTYENVRLHRRP
ncbi:Uma2 family endonuclease [Streptomyces sp. NPDC059866]|uniref:Uma2 family endonuclease n=1 Tax=Streptomyces sp. NPDC059866 TaxID=3346978 RepID=UPI003658421D